MELEPKPPDLTSDRGRYSTIRGIVGATYFGIDETGMAPYNGRLTLAEIWDVAAFVRQRQSKPE